MAVFVMGPVTVSKKFMYIQKWLRQCSSGPTLREMELQLLRTSTVSSVNKGWTLTICKNYYILTSSDQRRTDESEDRNSAVDNIEFYRTCDVDVV
jgi:hypothetical protein